MLSHGGRSVPGYALAGFGLGAGWQAAVGGKVNPGEWFEFAFSPSDAKGGHGTNGSWTDADVEQMMGTIGVLGMDTKQTPPVGAPPPPSGYIVVRGKYAAAATDPFYVNRIPGLESTPVAVMTMASTDAAAAKSNTMLYVAGGVAAVVVLGGAYYMMRK
jgi:hypothetical protein